MRGGLPNLSFLVRRSARFLPWLAALTTIGALALVAIGYRSLSLSPSAVGPVKAMLLDLNARKAAALIQPLIDCAAGSVPIRERLKAFATEEGLQL